MLWGSVEVQNGVKACDCRKPSLPVDKLTTLVHIPDTGFKVFESRLSLIFISVKLAKRRSGVPDKASAMDIECLKYLKFDMELLRR